MKDFSIVAFVLGLPVGIFAAIVIIDLYQKLVRLWGVVAEDYYWFNLYPDVTFIEQNGQVRVKCFFPRTALGRIDFYLQCRIEWMFRSLKCWLRGKHEWEVEGWSGPESGGESGHCLCCGKSFHNILY